MFTSRVSCVDERMDKRLVRRIEAEGDLDTDGFEVEWETDR